MLQLGLGVVAGFIAWLVLWIGGEKCLSLMFPRAFGVHQHAFQAALTEGAAFAPDQRFLLSHVALAAPVTLLAGLVSAWGAGAADRAPVILGLVLLLIGILKAVMSWRLVPLWYHSLFTSLLFPMAVLGGQLFVLPIIK